MSHKRSLWKMLFISFFAFLVVACKPIAGFSVSPDPVKAGVEATFDASSSMADVTPKNNAIKSYAWDFGDGATATGKTAKHTFAAAGTFKVKLTVIDTAGRKGEATEKLVVTTGDVLPQTTALTVITQIAGGVSLTGAEVRVGTDYATSNDKGLATLSAAPVGANQVVTVKKAGYVTQSVRATVAAGAEPQQVLVLLLPEKDTLSIAAIETAQTIKSNFLGASVKLPANALVNAATGVPATGAATLKLTPWDISGIDLQAMPANGRARDLQGNLVDLISAGMMTVDFFDAAGNKLQVAPGKTADIQMDLPAGLTSIGGNALSVGSAIPMWHFDETLGLWIEEGVGSVVATDKGLGVIATVKHFSTWNWDFKFESAGSVNVSCVDANTQLVACSVVADVTLADGSKISKSTSLPAAVTNVINMPSSGSIQWAATTSDGLVGQTTSGTSGNVVINISAPTTSNLVKCTLPDGTAVGCTVDLDATLTNGDAAPTSSRYVPFTGALVKTSLSTNGLLNWKGKSAPILGADGQWRIYSGAASSSVSGDVNLSLTDSSVTIGKTIYVRCDPALGGDGEALTACSLTVRIYASSEQVLVNITVPDALSSPVAVLLPPNAAGGGWVQIEATGTVASPNETFQGWFYEDYDSVQDGEQVQISLNLPS